MMKLEQNIGIGHFLDLQGFLNFKVNDCRFSL